MRKTIVHYGIRVTWSDGEKEWLDDIPDFKDIENYLDVLEEEENLWNALAALVVNVTNIIPLMKFQ